MIVQRDSAAFCCDIPSTEVKVVDVGNPPGAVDDALDLGHMLRSSFLIDNAKTFPCPLDPLNLDTGADFDPKPLGLLAQLRDSIHIHIGEQPRECLKDRDLDAGSDIDMAELERDHPAADKHGARRKSALSQYVIGADHQLGTRKR